MKIARLKVVKSTSHPDLVSLRGPKGQGQNDGAHSHLTTAGFVDGERVVVITEADLLALRDAWDRGYAAGFTDGHDSDREVPNE